MAHSEQIGRSAAIMLLGNGGWLVPHDLRDNAGRGFNPFCQGAELRRRSRSVTRGNVDSRG